MSIERLLEKRKQLVFMLEYFSKKANEIEENATQEHIGMRLSKLEEVYGQFQTHVTQLQASNEYDMAKFMEEHVKVEENYLIAAATLKHLRIGNDETFQNPLERTIHHYEQQAPALEVPPFHGNYEEWRSFEDLFLASVANARSSDAQKYQRLKSLLRGEAVNAVKHLTITNENYAITLGLLRKRYNNKRAMVNRYMKLLFTTPKLTVAKSTTIATLLNTINECIQALISMDINVATWDPIIVFLIESKLDQQTHKDWEFFLKGSVEIPSLQSMLTFLDTTFRTLESFERATFDEQRVNKTSTPNSGINNKYQCSFCHDGTHRLFECKAFQQKTTAEKFTFVSTKNLCFNCLSPNHNAAACQSKFKCKFCGERHNSLLHERAVNAHLDVTNADEREEGTDEDEMPDELSANLANTFDHILLATAMVWLREKEGKKSVKVRALLDQGSQGSFISEDLAQQLRLKKTKVNIAVSGIGNGKCRAVKHAVEFEMQSRTKNYCLKMSAMVIKSVTAIRATPRIPNCGYKHLHDIELADPHYQRAGCIDLLIGADVFAQLILPGLVKGDKDSPIAQQTEIGWIVSGSTSNKTQTKIIAATATINNLDDLVKRFWHNGDIELDSDMADEEIRAEQHFVNTFSRDESGRYAVRLPFKSSTAPTFIGTRRKAIRRAIQNESMLNKKPDLMRQYNTAMQEYIDLSHMSPSIIQGPNDDGFFKPHHAVIKESSSTTKVRPVFDASMKDDNGLSINETFMVGPTLQPKLSNALLRWREHEFVFATDIEKMYRQILVDRNDCKYQQIVWRDAPDKPFVNYTMNRLVFGTAHASCSSVRCIKQLAMDYQDEFQSIASIILVSSYIDDLFVGDKSIANLKEKQEQLITLFGLGGFALRKWTSNVDEILNNIPIEWRETIKTVNDMTTIKTLGIQWMPNADKFSFTIRFDDTISSPTKRQYLSQIAKVFDPLGFLAPFVVMLKILLQRICKENIEWDEQISKQKATEWCKIVPDANSTQRIHVDRWLSTGDASKKITLVGFCDASENAFAAVVFCRVEDMHGTCKIKLVTAKTRVAPQIKQTIPRLELNAAVLLAELMDGVQQSIQAHDVYAFGDSMVVQAWITGPPERRKQYVQRRVEQIRSMIDVSRWHYICSAENPADCASRGLHLSTLKQHKLWWNGPDWLIKPTAEWPIVQRVVETPLERKAIKLQTNHIVNNDDDLYEWLKRFSSYERMIRATMYVLRYVNNWRAKRQIKLGNTGEMLTGLFTVAERKSAIVLWSRRVQSMHFADEIRQLNRGLAVPKKSKLRNLNPFIDADGIIRVGGRLQNALISYNRKHQIIAV